MDLRLGKAVENVVIVRWDDNGRRVAKTVYRRGKKRKAGTGPLETLSKVVRRVAAGQRSAADTYLKKHDEANRDEPDGWVRELPYNVYRATRRGIKKVGHLPGVPFIEID